MMKLRQNWAVQEVVEAFQQARPSILQMGKELRTGHRAGAKKKRKRKVEDIDLGDDISDPDLSPRQRTRSQHISPSASPIIAVEPTDQSDEDYEPGKHWRGKGISNAYCPLQVMVCQLVQSVETG